MKCKDVGLEDCYFCQTREMECWIEFYERCLVKMNGGDTKKTIIQYMSGERALHVEHLLAVIKHKYPQYEKLLLLL